MKIYSIFAGLLLAAATTVGADAQRVVILHTNDTHSQIDPDKKNRGGVLRRKALVDSVRGAEKNVLLVDAGDAVQGSLFFTLFEGEVEQALMNALGYDIQIVGNHEFDNGIEKLRRQLKNAEAELVSTNYDFSGTDLEGMFMPYVIKDFEGKRIGFIGINVDPRGLIDPDNYAGLRYADCVEAANAMADYLKDVMKVDAVVALTHIGYEEKPGADDRSLAQASRNIDVIIGGHSHDDIFPGSGSGLAETVTNSVGKPVTVAQMGKSGLYVGEVTLDFGAGGAPVVESRGIAVDGRLDSRVSRADSLLLAPFRAKVDSISSIKIGTAAIDMGESSNELSNFMADWVLGRGKELAGKEPDFALVNKGGLRNSIGKGDVTQGTIINMLPFNNRVVVVEMKGDSLQRLMDIIAGQGGQAVSRGVSAKLDVAAKKAHDVKINGKKIDPSRTYTIATIDYLSRGGDSMTPFVTAPVVAKSENLLYRDLIDDMSTGRLKGVPLKADGKARMVRK